MKKNISETPKKVSQVTLLLTFQTLIGLLSVIGSLFIFLKLAREVFENELYVFDTSILQYFYSIRTPFLTEIMRMFTFLGGNIVITSATLITIFLLWKNRYRKDALLFAFILIFGVILNLLLKDIFGRQRPDLFPLVFESSSSFPSGHAMNSLVFYSSLTYFVFHISRKKRFATILIVVTILLVSGIGLSRIYLGAHYPSDVLAGYAAGLLWFSLVILCRKTLIFYRIFRNK